MLSSLQQSQQLHFEQEFLQLLGLLVSVLRVVVWELLALVLALGVRV